MLELQNFQINDLSEARQVFVESWMYLADEILNLDYTKINPWLLPLNPTSVVKSWCGIIGFSQVKENELERLYVLPEFHGLGASKLLLKDAEARGANVLFVDEKNCKARKFYEKNGWTKANYSKPGYIFPDSHVIKYIN